MKHYITTPGGRIKAGLFILAAIVVFIVVSALTGCGSLTGSPHAASSVSAFAQNPQVRADQVRALRKIAACADQATGGQLTFTVVNSAQGEANVPGTSDKQPQVQVTHVSLGLFHHLRDKIKAAVDCAVPPGTKTAVEKCISHLQVPVHKSAVQGYLIGLAGCTVQP